MNVGCSTVEEPGETANRKSFADFAEVGEDFIEDDFNLTGLSQLVPFYKEALEMVLDVEPGKPALDTTIFEILT
jgi:hypothetical protein